MMPAYRRQQNRQSAQVHTTSSPQLDPLPPPGNTVRLIQVFESMSPKADDMTTVYSPVILPKRRRNLVRGRVQHIEKVNSQDGNGKRVLAAVIPLLVTPVVLFGKESNYLAKLRAAEALTLPERSKALCAFLQQHDEIMAGLLVAKKYADHVLHQLSKQPYTNDWSVLHGCLAQANYIQIEHRVALLLDSGTPERVYRLRERTSLYDRINATIDALKQEIVSILTEADGLLPRPDRPVEYENVGPDHHIDAFGYSIPLDALAICANQTQGASCDSDCDPYLRCCLCLDDYSESDPPFQLTQCQHVVGRACMSRWLNSTQESSTRCPQCRAPLTERRPRRPAAPTEAQRLRLDTLSGMCGQASHILHDVLDVVGDIWGQGNALNIREQLIQEWNVELMRRDVGWRCVDLPWGFRRQGWTWESGSDVDEGGIEVHEVE